VEESYSLRRWGWAAAFLVLSLGYAAPQAEARITNLTYTATQPYGTQSIGSSCAGTIGAQCTSSSARS